MNEEELFGLLVRYHIEHNLPRFLPTIEDGRSSLVEDSDIGYDEAAPRGVKRFLLIANGDTLASRLRETGVILDRRSPEFHEVGDEDALYSFFDNLKGDGAYILNKEKGRIARVHHLKNDFGDAESLDYLLEMPREMLTYDERLPSEEAGCKTRLAAKLPHAYDGVDAYQIKATVHSPLGLGIVTHFGRGYLETFTLEHAKGSGAPMIDEEKQITGVYRRYDITLRGYVLTEQKYMAPATTQSQPAPALEAVL